MNYFWCFFDNVMIVLFCLIIEFIVSILVFFIDLFVNLFDIYI